MKLKRTVLCRCHRNEKKVASHHVSWTQTIRLSAKKILWCSWNTICSARNSLQMNSNISQNAIIRGNKLLLCYKPTVPRQQHKILTQSPLKPNNPEKSTKEKTEFENCVQEIIQQGSWIKNWLDGTRRSLISGLSMALFYLETQSKFLGEHVCSSGNHEIALKLLVESLTAWVEQHYGQRLSSDSKSDGWTLYKNWL